MATERNDSSAGWRLARRAVPVGWKLAIIAVVAAVVVYRLRYAPVVVDANVAALADAPWTLTPAVAIFLVVLAVNLIVQRPTQRRHVE